MIDYRYCGIYTITHTKTGELYVGSSINMIERMRKHIGECIRGKHANYKLQNAFNEMVQNFIKTESFSFDFRFEPYSLIEASELDEYEYFYMQELNPTFNIDTKIQRNSNRVKSINADYSLPNDRQTAYLFLKANEEREKLNTFYAECRANNVYGHSINELNSDEILFQFVKYWKSIEK